MNNRRHVGLTVPFSLAKTLLWILDFDEKLSNVEAGLIGEREQATNLHFVGILTDVLEIPPLHSHQFRHFFGWNTEGPETTLKAFKVEFQDDGLMFSESI